MCIFNFWRIFLCRKNKNIFKNKDIEKRKEEFTKKWAEFINKCENNKLVMQK